MRRANVGGLLLGIVIVAALVAPAAACTTPVYRYAMYNWGAMEFEVFALHRGPLSAEDEATHAALETVVADRGRQTNLAFYAVDVTREGAIDGLPPDVRAAWERAGDDAASLYVVLTPRQQQLHAGKLSAADVEQMVNSPARIELAGLLEEGRPGVLLVLRGKEPGFSSEAADEAALRKLVRRAEAEIRAELNAGATSGPPLPEVAVMLIDREDPEEEWLVRALLTVEDDLAELELPMLFGVYGKARASLPLVGEGIRLDNLVDVLGFMRGPCSCEAQSLNPGMSLLTRWDWEGAADLLAEKFAREDEALRQSEGPGRSGAGIPDITIYETGDTAPREGTANDTVPEDAVPNDGATDTQASSAATDGDAPSSAADGTATAATSPTSRTPTPRATSPADRYDQGLNRRLATRLGIGAALIAAVLVIVTLVMFRPRG